MTLEDIYEQLSVGELRLLFIGEGGDSFNGVPPSKYAELLPSVKLGLSDLHKRFLLRERTFTLQMVEGKVSYHIDIKYAESNTSSSEPVKWITDASDPFEADLLRIERVYAEDGTELTLNLLGDADALRTPAYNYLVVPDTLETQVLTVVYRADHPAINKYIANAAPSQVPIELPTSHLNALLMFVGSRIMNPTGMSGTFHEGNNYAMKYEAECALLTELGVGIGNQTMENTRFTTNGWV
jgi:hypothetical protein